VFKVPVGDLLRHPGERRRIDVGGPIAAATIGATVAAEAGAELLLESLDGGSLAATGSVRAEWVGECRRCLGEARGQVTVEVRELFERGSDGEETYPVQGDQIDVEPLVRDAVLLDLPLAPLCREACAGLCPVCGANKNDLDCGHRPDDRDPRWAALDELKEPDGSPQEEDIQGQEP
jgi:uncharacterized protein